MFRLVTVATAIIVAFTVGCASTGKRVQQDSLSQFVVGETTRQDIESKLGAPQRLEKRVDNSVVMHYEHVRSTPKAVNFIPIADLLFAGADVTKTHAQFILDKDGVLIDIVHHVSEDEVRTGWVTQSE